MIIICVWKKEREQLYLLFFIDDLLLLGNCEETIDELKPALCKNFETKDLGIADNYLGNEIVTYNFKIELSQNKYLESVLGRFVSLHPWTKVYMSKPLVKNAIIWR